MKLLFKCKKYRKFKNFKIFYILNETLVVLFINCYKCGSNSNTILKKEECTEIFKTLGLTDDTND